MGKKRQAEESDEEEEELVGAEAEEEEERQRWLVGRRIRIYWGGDKEWYAGVVARLGQGRYREKHHVHYDDGDREWHCLKDETWELLHSSAEEEAEEAEEAEETSTFCTPVAKVARSATPRVKPSWTWAVVTETPRCIFDGCVREPYHRGICMGRSVLPWAQGASDGTGDHTSDHTKDDESVGACLRSRAGKGKSTASPLCDDGCCLICFERAEVASDLVSAPISSSGPTAGRTQCGHLYHTACLSRWLRQLQADKRPPCCPVCRHPLSMSSRRFFRDASPPPPLPLPTAAPIGAPSAVL